MTDQATKNIMARRRNAAKRRKRIESEGRRLDLLLDTDPARALASIEARTGERPTVIIGRLLVEAATSGAK